MTYTKPEVVTLGSAASAIQSQGQRVKGSGLQTEIAFPHQYTLNAYDADE